jgi:hypothetical protein
MISELQGAVAKVSFALGCDGACLISVLRMWRSNWAKRFQLRIKRKKMRVASKPLHRT